MKIMSIIINIDVNIGNQIFSGVGVDNPTSVAVEEDEIICNCFQIPESTIRAYIEKNNITKVEDVTSGCEAGGNCGSCHILIQLFIDQNKHQKKLEQSLQFEAKKLKTNKKSFWKRLLTSS